MQLKQISERGQDGCIETNACLVEMVRDNSGRNQTERTIYNLGSMGNGGFDKLIDLINSAHYLLLEPALENRRDSIVCSRSYGVVYLITQLLEKWDITANSLLELDYPASNYKLFNLLPSLIAALLDCCLKPDSDIDNLQRRIYSPVDIDLNAAAIRNLIYLFNDYPLADNYPDIDNNFIYDYFSAEFSTVVSKEHSDDRSSNGSWINKVIAQNLLTLATADCGSWYELVDVEGMNKIVSLTGYLYDFLEKQTAMELRRIYDHLSELQAIRVERGAKTLLLMTRPTSIQLSIFYRLGIKPPPLVMCEQVEKAIVMENRAEFKTDEAVDFAYLQNQFVIAGAA